MNRLAHQSSGISRGLDFLIAENGSAEQALAVIELIDDLCECIANHYQVSLHERLRQPRSSPGNPHPRNIDADPF